ncbi:MAG: hypothetical protein AAFV77_11345 [Planctomycetota bacterium]
MFIDNPLPSKTSEFLSLRPMPAAFDVRREGSVVRVVDRLDEFNHEPPMHRSIVLCVIWHGCATGCIWSLRQAWIAAAILCLIVGVLAFLTWWGSDADHVGRELQLDFEAGTATLIVGGARRKHRRTWHVPLDAVSLVACPIKGFFRTGRGSEISIYSGVGVFAIVPGGSENALEFGWMMLGGSKDESELLLALAQELPELGAPMRFSAPIRGQLDRSLL